jgi:type I restriction enzyme S subunit
MVVNMGNKFNKTTLHGKLTIKHGFPFKGEYFSSKGQYIVLTPGNFYEKGGFKRELGKEKYTLEKFPIEYLHKKNDLIVAMTEQAEGLLGSMAFVPQDNLYLHNQRLGLVTVDEEYLDKKFVYYLFQSKYIRKQIRDSSSGTKVKHTSPERIYDVVAFLPDISNQQKIGNLLLTLDRKIELNNKINKELETMAKTLYDYWFVQFDFPDENGKPYKSSGGAMEYNQKLKRKIPNGWKLENIANSKLTSIINPEIESYDGKKIYLSTSEVENNDITNHSILEEYDSRPSRANMQPEYNSIWFARMKDTKKVILLGDYSNDIIENYIFSTGFTGLRINQTALFYIWNYIHNDWFEEVKNINATGSTQKAIINEAIANIPLVIPSDTILKMYYDKVYSIYKKIYINQRENLELAKLRDWLLPMLMNGQVSVK